MNRIYKNPALRKEHSYKGHLKYEYIPYGMFFDNPNELKNVTDLRVINAIAIQDEISTEEITSILSFDENLIYSSGLSDFPNGVRAVKSVFPYRNKMSFLLGAYKFYRALNEDYVPNDFYCK